MRYFFLKRYQTNGRNRYSGSKSAQDSQNRGFILFALVIAANVWASTVGSDVTLGDLFPSFYK